MQNARVLNQEILINPELYHPWYAQAGLRLCWSNIPHCWKSHVVAHIVLVKSGHVPIFLFEQDIDRFAHFLPKI